MELTLSTTFHWMLFPSLQSQELSLSTLETSSPIVSVIDIFSSDVSDDAYSTAIRRAGLRADATDSCFDTIPIATQTPDHTRTPISAPVATSTVVPSDTDSSLYIHCSHYWRPTYTTCY
ncbi:hypothetical protein Hanom_Chr15g01400071 [Helianthus anomalus]